MSRSGFPGVGGRTGRRLRLDDHGDAGFLYVEVLAALVLLGLTLLSAMPLFFTAARQNASSSDEATAAISAHDIAERLKRTPFTALASGSDVVFQRQAGFDRVWTVADNTPHPGIRRVTIVVTPRRQDGFGGVRAATLVLHRVP